MAESNLLSCRKQFKVYESYSDYHMRFQILTKQLPMEVVIKHADLIQWIRDSHTQSTKGAEKISGLVDNFPIVDSLRELLATAKQCGSSKLPHGGQTEQSHTLKKKLNAYEWGNSFMPANFFHFYPIFTY